MCSPSSLRRRRLMLAMAGATVLVAACGKKPEGAAQPQEIESATACVLDGMLLADYPGPKAQIFYAGFTSLQEYANFCDARGATVAAAGPDAEAIGAAWDAVGVYDGCDPGLPPPPPCERPGPATCAPPSARRSSPT